MVLCRLPRLCWFLLLVPAVSIRQDNGRDDNQCGLYLAESSIPNAGWGVFAGKGFQTGDRVEQAGVGIQVHDPQRFVEPMLSAFLWDSGPVGGFHEAEHVSTLLPGVGMLANHYDPLVNVISGGLQRDENMYDRFTDPQAGANTEYHDFSFRATASIRPGEEIFVDLPQSRSMGNFTLPRMDDYDRAELLIKGFMKYRKLHPDLSPAQWNDILYRMKREMLPPNDPMADIIPRTLEELQVMVAKGVAHAPLLERSIHWLQREGICLDHIREGRSTIADAGRGAFATRFLAKGSVVAPAPLVHINQRNSLRGSNTPGLNTTVEQLLVNYCFGHRHSSILLCPTTHVTLINHNSEEPNVELRWAKSSTNRRDADKDYLLEPLEALMLQSNFSRNTRLMLEFVATKDIQQGDEIFLDYGSEWETAYRRHVSQWRRPTTTTTARTTSSQMNLEQRAIEPSSVSQDFGYECRLEPFANQVNRFLMEEDYHTNPFVDPAEWDARTKLLVAENIFLAWWPCNILEIEDDGASFRAEVYSKYPEQQTQVPKQQRTVVRLFRKMPRNAIRYVDKPYQSDQSLPNAFRHYIPIPDSLFPLHWRDDYEPADSLRLGVVDEGIDMHLLVDTYEQDVRRAECGEYIAPSNIPNAGFGVYAAVRVAGPGVTLGSQMSALPIPRIFENEEDFLGGEYTWGSKGLGCEYETCHNSFTDVFGSNDATMANFHPGLVNVELMLSSFQPLLDRNIDPGAGAFSDFFDLSYESLQAIQAGQELFVSYGERWFLERPQFRNVPVKENYAEANSVIASLATLRLTNEDQLLDLLKLVRDRIVRNHRSRVALEHIRSVEAFEQVITSNGTAQSGIEIRSPAWLQENGYCIDHIYVKNSTLPQAGHGAFTRRFIKQGKVIITAPMLATWGRQTMEMKASFLPDNINRKKLILNYHYGHPESSVMFLPLTLASAINHNSARILGGRSPNAKLRWSLRNKKSAYFLQRPLEDLKKEIYSTMVMDFVAIKDIGVDEEVFIDYGETWENAWNEHVRNFRSCEDNCVMSSKFVKSMNYDKYNSTYHEWSDGHFTGCRTDEIEPAEHISLTRSSPQTGRAPMTLIDTISEEHPGFDLARIDASHSPCIILEANVSEKWFDVVVFSVDGDVRFLRRNRNFPEKAIEFTHKPYKSDMHWAGAFRHEIGIPNEIFPAHWRDLKSLN